MTRAATGRGDLLRALDVLGRAQRSEVARSLGFVDLGESRVERQPTAPRRGASEFVAGTRGTPKSETQLVRDSALFLRVVGAEFLDPKHDPAQRDFGAPFTPREVGGAVAPNRPVAPLSTWAHAQVQLRRGLGDRRSTSEIDVEALVRRWSQGRHVRRVPRRVRRSWPRRVVLLVDHSRRLTPFFADQERVKRQLARLLSASALEVHTLPDGPPGSRRCAGGPLELADACPVLALTDLGFCSGDADDIEAWHGYAVWLRAAGFRLAALLPVPSYRWQPAVARAWGAIPWERESTFDEERNDHADDSRARRLLQLVSPAVRVEPGLLRAIRLLLGSEHADVGTELDAWNHPLVGGRHSVAMELRPGESLEDLRQQFARESHELQRKVLEHIVTWHSGLAPELLGQELVGAQALGVALDEGSLCASETDEESLSQLTERAQLRLRRVAGTLRSDATDSRVRAAYRRWFGEFEQQVPAGIWSVPGVRDALVASWAEVHRGEDKAQAPPGVDPRRLAEVLGATGPRESWSVYQVGRSFVFRPANLTVASTGRGSPLESLDTARAEVKLTRERSGHGAIIRLNRARETRVAIPKVTKGASLILTTEYSACRLEVLRKPAWATAMGRDRYGLWVTFKIKGVAQRMRWIPPGRFLMGSPESEQGRFNDEGPQHEVIISRGYWLGETPVTQALWEAVTEGDNPSEFQSPERPVERVSWDECQQKFLARINELIPEVGGERFSLPSEAEWEYACRAGTTAATYAGEIEIKGERNAPVLDAIAWYGGNSGVEYELEHGHDSSSWEEKQHEHSKAGTHPVKRKQPNQWGLYDMLGNVDEWCMDDHREYNSEQQRDPMGATDTGEVRVFRGGSWLDDAWYCRAAYRLANPPGYRYGWLGFRLARGQVRSTGDGPEGP